MIILLNGPFYLLYYAENTVFYQCLSVKKQPTNNKKSPSYTLIHGHVYAGKQHIWNM